MARSGLLISALVLAITGACADETGTTFRNAITGEECVPNDTYIPVGAGHGNNGNGNTSPTGIPGDNLDDLRSGKIDCLGDGNSGQGDDKKHNCEGCDNTLCCDDGVLPPDDGDDDPDVDDPGDGDDGGDDGDDPDDGDDGGGDPNTDDGGGGGGGGGGDTPTCEQTCAIDADCGGGEIACVDGCCSAIVL